MLFCGWRFHLLLGPSGSICLEALPVYKHVVFQEGLPVYCYIKIIAWEACKNTLMLLFFLQFINVILYNLCK